MTLSVTDPQPVDRAGEILTPEALAFVEEPRDTSPPGAAMRLIADDLANAAPTLR